MSVFVGGSGGVVRGASSLLKNFQATATNPVLLLSTVSKFSGRFNGDKSCFGVPAVTLLGGVRHAHSKRVNSKVQRLVEGGVNYEGFSYFPRDPENFQDPPIEPSKLFMVKRIRSTKGCPWWEKDGIKTLKLERRGSIAIVKNTPAHNANLYKLKHLLEITPITVPYGMPDDPKYGFLKENGEFVSYNSLDGQLQLEEAEGKIEELKKKSVDGPTLKTRLRNTYYQRWN